MASQEVRITGLKEVVRSLEKYGAATEELRKPFDNIGKRVVTKAQGIVPVRSGALRDTIRASRSKNKSVVRAGTARVDYARNIDNATEFLTGPANSDLNQNVREVEKELEQLRRKYNL